MHTATSDALIFGTNGNNERMRIDTSGNILAGKTSSTGVATGNIEVSNSSSASVQIEGGTNEWSMLVSSSADALRFYQDSTERMRINSSGQVGIACTDQSNLLTVDANSASSGTDSISVRNRGVSSVNHTTGLRFQFNAAVPSAIRSSLTNAGNGEGTLSFYTSSDGS